jgi:phosphate transport system substrate-binding protein
MHIDSLRGISLCLAVAATTLAGIPPATAVTALPAYVPETQVQGQITSIGSDTMVYLVSYWAVEFKRIHPEARFMIAQAGSATAPPALLDGSATLGPMSRTMKDSEVQAFRAKFGYPPTQLRVAMDALAVYVNKDNPVAGMTLDQVDAVFSSTRSCGQPDDITTWGQLGLKTPWKDQPINVFGRNTLSGTYAFFTEHALCKGKFKKSLAMQATSVDVVRNVAAGPTGIGYSGIGYVTDQVHAVPLAAKSGMPFVAATPANVYNSTYPLSRYLYIYVNKAPGQPLPTLELEFLKMVLSTEGQHQVQVNGFIPLSPEAVEAELAKLR